MHALTGELAAFSPRLKPGPWTTKHSRGFDAGLKSRAGIAQIAAGYKICPRGLPCAPLTLKNVETQVSSVEDGCRRRVEFAEAELRRFDKPMTRA